MSNLTENYHSGIDLNKDLEEMLNLRQSKHIENVSNQMKALWRWYALVLLVKVSRSNWAWKQPDNRKSKHICECVSIGDEALVLTVLKLRAQDYFELREQKLLQVAPPKGRGRQRGTQPDPEKNLWENIDLYFDFREKITAIRTSEALDDKYGWNQYICKEARNEYNVGCTTKRSSKKKRQSYESLALPQDAMMEL